jgi:GlpG protein
MIRVVGVSIDNDLRDLSRYLRQQGVQHRIIEESGEQVIFVRDRQQVESVKTLVEDYLSGAFQLRPVEPERKVSEGSDTAISNSLTYKVLRVVFNAPVSSFLTLACLLVALITQLGRAAYRLDFMFYPNLPAGNLADLLAGIVSPLIFMQTLTPMFLHFGELHIVFNLLWLWYFGRQLEAVQSSWGFLLLVILTSFVGNTAQYLYSGASNFGGLSGVVYGLVGYAWVLHNFVPGKRLMLNESLFVVFMVALVLMEVLASSWIASAAHFGGLIAGLLAGAAVFVKFRLGGTDGR